MSGLTLLEMMVVLMIASMALALGFQSLSQWQRANAAIATLGSDARHSALTESWLRASLHGLVATVPVSFSGDATQLHGVTLAPVLASQGGATAVRWKLDTSPRAGPALVLEEDGTTMRLPLSDTRAAHFTYLDKDGRDHREWPPALGVGDQLPAAVALVRVGAEGAASRIWVTEIFGPRNPTDLPYEPDRD
ncbi:general secretion pathway protein J [Lysobacter ruishenii]|uniref:General secretion pathway protein J n=2 Tax=Aerolutibacter ruishenii TaxID=686800 RepID=A0A562M2W1_9GAMM|nr:general secretion pathway protein J [Lysobacter ruishenii]